MKNNRQFLHQISKLLIQPFLLALKIYRYAISPLLGNNCRHYPSCSQYSQESFQKHGVFKGLVLTTSRLIRCNPWSLGGFDPVPTNVNFSHPKSFKITGNYQTELYFKPNAQSIYKDKI